MARTPADDQAGDRAEREAFKTAAEDEGDAGTKSPVGGMDPKKKVIIGAIVAVVVIVSIIIITVSVTNSGGPQDCSKDDFKEVTFAVNKDAKDKQEKAYLKVKFFKKNEDDAFTMTEAKQACAVKGAELWEVADRTEWEAVMSNVETSGKEAFWLGAEVKEVCPGASGSSAKCKEADAMQGNGLKVRWPTTGVDSVYSRMIGGPNQQCIYVERVDRNGDLEVKRLWRKVPCDSAYFAACVKRNCKVPAAPAPA